MQQLKGVEQVISGYSGGSLKNPTYKEVCSGLTGHAEVVKVKFDPEIISLETLLRVFFYIHTPLSLDTGERKYSQYRSIIFYHNQEQREIAESLLKELNQEQGCELRTLLEPFQAFYQAEEHHQDYYLKGPEKGYCQNVIEPKLKKLRGWLPSGKAVLKNTGLHDD